MPGKASETGPKKPAPKSSRTKKSTLARQAIGPENGEDRHKIIAIAAYHRAEKRGFTGDDAERVQDWLEAEAEIDNASMY